MTDQGGGQSAPLLVLNKIADILDAFSLAQPELTLAEIREATGLPTSTVQRLAGNLAAHGFLDRTANGYRVGLKMSYWAAPATHDAEILDVIKPVLNELRDETGESVAFFQTSLEYRVCVAIAETHHVVRRDMRVGRILPLHAGSAGRVLLAWDPVLAEKVLSKPLETVTEHTITDKEEFRRLVDRTRADGFAISVEERETGASGLSAPVFNAQADLVGALTIMGPVIRMPLELCHQLVDTVVEGAERVTRMIGGRRPVEYPTG